MLSSGAGGTEHLHLNIRRVQLHVHFLHLRQHRYHGMWDRSRCRFRLQLQYHDNADIAHIS